MLWIEKPEVLWDVQNLKYFVPSSGMTWDEQANSTVRFIFYLSLILYLYYDNPLLLFVPVGMVMGLQCYLHKEGKLQSMMETLFFGGVQENFEAYAPSMTEAEQNKFDQYDGHNMKVDPNNQDSKEEQIISGVDERIREEFGDDHKDHNEPLTTRGPRPDMGLERAEPEFQPKVIEAKTATANNPFCNAMPFDTVDRQTIPATPNEYSKDQKFYEGLFNNLDDLFDRNNSQRQFTTMPASTRINDREAAMQFFYNTPYSEH